MFAHKKIKKPEDGELVELKCFNNEDAIDIQEKLSHLSTFTPKVYDENFYKAYRNYMAHRSSVFTFRGTHFGWGCMEENTSMRPYMYYLAQRIEAKKLYETNKELLLLLNEPGRGKDKKSLNFHVLVAMFDLDYEKYNDTSATQLIEDTLKILRIKYPEIKPETGARMVIAVL